jgi:hypothetical protein
MSIEINLLQGSVTALYMFFPVYIFSAVGKEFCVVRKTRNSTGCVDGLLGQKEARRLEPKQG